MPARKQVFFAGCPFFVREQRPERTLLDVITGKVRPRNGRVVFQGRDHAPRDITRRAEQDIARLGIGRKFQTPNIFKSLTVLENLRLAVKAPRGVLPTLAASLLYR